MSVDSSASGTTDLVSSFRTSGKVRADVQTHKALAGTLALERLNHVLCYSI